MKNILRYLIAVLIIGSLGIWFIPLLDITVEQLSVADVVIIGFGFYSGSAAAERIYASIQTYLSACAWGIVAAAVFVLLEAVFTAILRKRKGYIISLISSIINAIAGCAVFVLVWSGTEEVKESMTAVLTEDIVSVSFIPIIAWLGICTLVFILSITGIVLWAFDKRRQEKIYTEQIDRRNKNQRSDEGNRPVSKPQKKSVVQTFPRQNIEEPTSFSGAIMGMTGLFAGKAYPLENITEVYFREEDRKIFITPYEEADNLAGIYYISQYQEYCMEPLKRQTVFLESGQPLGKGRKYYLPRGMKIFLKEKGNMFTLA